ncbi:MULTISPECIES: hypothetical protein [Allobacillus]|uniref:DUF1310 family protein n=1 Tax=Allobacillus salarius TaxID=1955272 RepID=A0A556P6G5_9BACI|nr:hypothetical protein [Allobacillus salarius]TSJ59976.1 hypothetical protein FPQ13_12690 [Allobacillus salarius]
MKKWIFIFLALCVAISIVYIFYFKTTTFKEVFPSLYENNIKSIQISEKIIDDKMDKERKISITDQEVIKKLLKESSDMKLKKNGDFHSEASNTTSFYFISVIFENTSENFSFYMVDSGLRAADSYTIVENNNLKQALNNHKDVDWESVK